MSPIPCSHCGNNFMRRDLHPDAPKLCNNCEVRENRRTNKEPSMETIGILIQCPREDQIEIEEFCVNQGMDFSKYFLGLHYARKLRMREEEALSGQEPEEEENSGKHTMSRKGKRQ